MPPSSTTVTTISPNFWISKQSAYKLWQNINTYVNDYLSDHQDEMHSDWFTNWYQMFEVMKIGDKNCEYQITAYLIAKNPDAIPLECFHAISTTIPNIKSYFIVTDKSSSGNFKCTIKPYRFTTPKLTTKSPPRKKVH